MIYLDGSSTSLLSIWSGDERYDEVWVGGDKIWPDVGTGGGFLIRIPDAGTLDYQYWLHAVDAIENGGAGYMKFTVNGTDFYVNDGPNGAEVVQLRGDVIALTAKQLEMMGGPPGERIELEADIKQREGVEKVIRANKENYEMSWELPLIAGAQFQVKLTNYSSSHSSYGAVTEFYSMPSGKAFPGFSVMKHQRTRITSADTVKEGDVPVGDTACKAQAYTSGGCYYDPSKSQYQYVVPVWPSFKKVFTLDVVYVS